MAENAIDPQVKPIVLPSLAEWNLGIIDTDYNKMLKGFTPQQMVCVADEPDTCPCLRLEGKF
jgi:hypothetical protein